MPRRARWTAPHHGWLRATASRPAPPAATGRPPPPPAAARASTARRGPLRRLGCRAPLPREETGKAGAPPQSAGPERGLSGSFALDVTAGPPDALCRHGIRAGQQGHVQGRGFVTQQCLELLMQGPSALGPLLGALGQQLQHQLPQRGWHLGVEHGRRGGHLVLNQRGEHLPRQGGWEGRHAREHLVQGGAQRVEIVRGLEQVARGGSAYCSRWKRSASGVRRCGVPGGRGPSVSGEATRVSSPRAEVHQHRLAIPARGPGCWSPSSPGGGCPASAAHPA